MGRRVVRGESGQFQSTLRNDEILAEILLAKLAAAKQGEAFTSDLFDVRRPEGCPTAERAVKRLSLSWDELVALCEQPMKALRLSGVRRAHADRRSGTAKGAQPEEALFALRLVGRRLGWRPSRFDYAVCRGEILAKAKRRRSSALTLPTVSQIEAWLDRPFREACHEACSALPPPPITMTPDAVLQLALEASGGVLPTSDEMVTFCAHNNISVVSVGTLNGSDHFEMDLEEPAAAASSRPDFAVDLPVSERNQPWRWSEPECVHALALYLLDLAPGQEVSQASYQHFSSHRKDIPWYKSFTQHGGFEALLPKARALEKRMRDGFDPAPALLERRRQRRGGGCEAVWAEILDAQGHAPWEPAPDYDGQQVLCYLANRRGEAWCAYLVMLDAPDGATASDVVTAGIASAHTVSEWRRELDELCLVECCGRHAGARAAGRHTSRWRLKGINLSEDIRARAEEAPLRRSDWRPLLDTTLRAIAQLDEPSRFYPRELARALSISGQNIASRLKQLQALGAVELIETRRNERGSPGIWSLTLTGRERLRQLDAGTDHGA